MRALKETTKWDSNVPNHTYILNDADQLKAYVIVDTGEYHEFKKPINVFSKSRRTFKEVEIVGGPF